MSQQQPKGARDRMRAEMNPVFAQQILSPIFEYNSIHHFYPLVNAHQAWLTMLAERGIVGKPEAAKILRALEEIGKAGPDSLRPFDASVEFYYLHMERALMQRVEGGEAIVGNLNMGRTRPEPLARMALREKLLDVIGHVINTRKVLIKRAAEEAETVMPGYTHLLHAQVTTLGHYLLAVHDHLERDTRRLLSALETTDQCTLGCGAMSGTSLPVDRDRVRELLGFSKICENTIDSVSASDHVTESAAAIASVMTILGRLAQDLYVWSCQEFNLIDVTDSFSSPSSLMPQKKNALVLEYVRSRTARVIGSLTGTFTVLHNVGYMDTEEVEYESYQPLFEGLKLTLESVPTMAELLRVMQPNREVMRKSASWGFSSVTMLAEGIQTHEKLSYRTAHRIVARSVLLAVEKGRDATGIDREILDQAAMEMIGRKLTMSADEVKKCLDPRNFVDHHAVPGGAAPAEVKRMAKAREARLAADEKTVTQHRARIDGGKEKLREAVRRVMA